MIFFWKKLSESKHVNPIVAILAIYHIFFNRNILPRRYRPVIILKFEPQLRTKRCLFSQVTSHPMNYAALANFALDIDSITAEFAEIPTVNVRPEEVPPGCEDKNRYSNVLPLPETRVPLKRIGNDSTTEYINANYVTVRIYFYFIYIITRKRNTTKLPSLTSLESFLRILI